MWPHGFILETARQYPALQQPHGDTQSGIDDEPSGRLSAQPPSQTRDSQWLQIQMVGDLIKRSFGALSYIMKNRGDVAENGAEKQRAGSGI